MALAVEVAEALVAEVVEVTEEAEEDLHLEVVEALVVAEVAIAVEEVAVAVEVVAEAVEALKLQLLNLIATKVFSLLVVKRTPLLHTI